MVLQSLPAGDDTHHMSELITDCALCGLPTESRIEFDVEDVVWATLVCIKGHWVVAPVEDLV